MWELKEDFANKTRLAQYAKKHRAEYTACFANLGRLHEALAGGLTLQQCTFGFFGSEGMDIYRIGQSGVPHAHETRLYIYAAITGGEIQVLTIGDKKSQSADIRWCHAQSQVIRNQKRENHGETAGNDE